MSIVYNCLNMRMCHYIRHLHPMSGATFYCYARCGYVLQPHILTVNLPSSHATYTYLILLFTFKKLNQTLPSSISIIDLTDCTVWSDEHLCWFTIGIG